MHRLAVVSLLTFCAVCASAQSLPSSDPYAVSLAQQSVAAITGGAPINGTAWHWSQEVIGDG